MTKWTSIQNPYVLYSPNSPDAKSYHFRTEEMEQRFPLGKFSVYPDCSPDCGEGYWVELKTLDASVGVRTFVGNSEKQEEATEDAKRYVLYRLCEILVEKNVEPQLRPASEHSLGG